jgi:hypothetical protein
VVVIVVSHFLALKSDWATIIWIFEPSRYPSDFIDQSKLYAKKEFIFEIARGIMDSIWYHVIMLQPPVWQLHLSNLTISNSTQHTGNGTTLTEFHLFTELPLEPQQKIWDFYLPGTYRGALFFLFWNDLRGTPLETSSILFSLETSALERHVSGAITPTPPPPPRRSSF